jgi:hypothetical protein
MLAEDDAILRSIKQALPNAKSRSPTEVLKYVKDILGAADAKVIDALLKSAGRSLASFRAADF